MRLVIFTTCKPFLGDDAWRQEQAIKSWLELKDIEIKIVIIGNDRGVKEICEQYNLIHHPKIKTFQNVPYVYDMFMIGASYADEEDYLLWTNCDIIYFQELIQNIISFEKIKQEQNLKKFVLVGQRYDWFNPKKLDNYDKEVFFKNINLNKHNSVNISKTESDKYEISLHEPCGIDYIIHSKTTYLNEFNENYVIAGAQHDLALLGTAIKRNIYTCNLTQTNTCIHLNHSYKNREVLIKKLKLKNSSVKNQQKKQINNCKYKTIKKDKIEFV